MIFIYFAFAFLIFVAFMIRHLFDVLQRRDEQICSLRIEIAQRQERFPRMKAA